MPASITLSSLSWTTPDGRSLFDLDLSFGPERAGLVGRNGVGKTTLLRLIAGKLRPQAGSIAVNGRLSILRQSIQVDPAETIASLFGATEALALLRHTETGEATAEELADADWTLEARMESALAQVGLDAQPDTPLATLSGGQATRARLAALVFAEPDFLLLDEPTNNLDREGRAAVIDLLGRWRGGAVVVSHDRELLETMDAIVELTSLGATRYGGNWSQYRERRALELAAVARDLADAEKRVGEIDRKTQAVAERKARKDGAGQRKRAKGDMPRTRDASSQMRWLEAERAARAELQRAAKLQDDFLANISHELRTPLNAIAGWAHVLARSDAEPGLMQRAAEAIGRNARTQALLVDDLLDMNRIVRGTLAIERRPCDLAAALDRALEAAKPAAAAKWIALEVDAPAAGLGCEGDPERLQQLFWNLIGNAVKYTPLNGKVWVALHTEAGRARVTVRDNGVGIAPALLPQLFERFQQAEGGITRRHGGLGIGLAIAKRVAELHGGTLTLASAGEGRGTEATVEIPLAAAGAGEAVAPAALPGARVETQLDDPLERRHLEAAVAERGVAPLAWRRILVVEDEADSLELLTLLLRQQGAVVRAFDHAEQALAAADNGVFDLVISDLGMPGMDGLEFVRRLRQRPHAPKAIALTAYSGGARHAEALEAGYIRVETKPIAPPQFLAVVIAEIGRGGRDRGAREGAG